MIKFVFTHLFDKDVWSTYYMPSIVLDPRDTHGSKTSSLLTGANVLMGKQQTCKPLRNSVSSASDEMLGRKANMGKRLETDEKPQVQCQMRNVSDTSVLLQGAKNLAHSSLVCRSLYLATGSPRGKQSRAGWGLSGDVKKSCSSIFPFHLISFISDALTFFFLMKRMNSCIHIYFEVHN